MNNPYFTPIIALDGHAGAGKSTVAKAVAQELGFWHVNTGMFYRAVTWWVLKNQLPLEHPETIAQSIQNLHIEVRLENGTQEMYLNDQQITSFLRTEDINQNISLISSYAPVRDIVNTWLRDIQHPQGIIMDGRDIGTVVAPEAPLKIFLTASVEERARRRLKDIEAQGEHMALDDLKQAIALRDSKDSHRDVAPLRQAPDAVLIDSSHMTQQEVIEQMISLWKTTALKSQVNA